MKGICFFVLAITFSFFVNSQVADTILYDYRTGGDLDSVDFANALPFSTFSGGVLGVKNNCVTPNLLYSKSGLLNFIDQPEYLDLRFSALPHLGFSYSFGGNATQFVHFDYQQSKNNTLLNIDFNRSSSSGFMRNSAFLRNDFKIQLNRLGEMVDVTFLSSYNNKEIGLSGGVTNDTFIELQGLEFLPVTYDDAQSKFKIAEVGFSNFYHKKKDSATYDSKGVQSVHRFNSVGRELVVSNFPISNFNIDSTSTRDQYRFASITNGVGGYLKNNKMFFNLLLNHKYWDYQNLGNHMDTNELNVTSRLSYTKGILSIQNDFYSNIIGAGQERFNKTSLHLKKNSFYFSGGFDFTQLWPLLNQRRYYSNLYNLSLSKYEIQTKIQQNLSVKWISSNDQSVKLKVSNYLMKDNYFFIGDQWRNDTLNSIKMQALEISAGLNYKFLYFNPDIQFNFISDGLDVLPSYTFNGRFFIKGSLFKAKKLKAIFGIDASYLSSYNTMSYNSYLDVFIFNNGLNQFNEYFIFSTYFGFEISEFRFYARIENISYPMTDIRNQVILGYPVQPNFVRLGVTWDFFN